MYYREMSTSITTIRNQHNSSVRVQWLNMIQTVSHDDPRITDYAQPLVDLLRIYRPALFSSEENRQVQAWMRQVYTFLHNESFLTPRFPDSNWQAYRLWVMSEICLITRNVDNIRFLRGKLFEYIILSLRPFPTTHIDYGGLIDFEFRDSMSYQVYTLFGILNAIVALEKELRITTSSNVIQHVWGPDPTLRRSIQPAIRFTLQFLNGGRTHIEFVDSKIAADRSRADYGKPYVRTQGTYLYRYMIENNFI